jgi:hypothetical protein
MIPPSWLCRIKRIELIMRIFLAVNLKAPRIHRPAYGERVLRFIPDLRVRCGSRFPSSSSGFGGKGIQDYASLFADEATIKTMMRNSGLIAEHTVSLVRSYLNRFLNGMFKEGAKAPADEEIERGIVELFKQVFQREPTEGDRDRYIEELFEKNRKLGDLGLEFRSLIVGMLMSQEFVFRMEVGRGGE